MRLATVAFSLAAAADCELPASVDPSSECVVTTLAGVDWGSLDVDEVTYAGTQPISLAMHTIDAAYTDHDGDSHSATQGALTPDPTNGRYLLSCSQTGGKTLRLTVTRPTDFADSTKPYLYFGGEFLQMYAKDKWDVLSAETEPYSFNAFGSKVPLKMFRPGEGALNSNGHQDSDFSAVTSPDFNVFMAVPDDGDFVFRYANPNLKLGEDGTTDCAGTDNGAYVAGCGTWTAIEFSKTLLRVGGPYSADCSAEAKASTAPGAIFPAYLGHPNLEGHVYADFAAKIKPDPVPAETIVVLDLFSPGSGNAREICTTDDAVVEDRVECPGCMWNALDAVCEGASCDGCIKPVESPTFTAWEENSDKWTSSVVPDTATYDSILAELVPPPTPTWAPVAGATQNCAAAQTSGHPGGTMQICNGPRFSDYGGHAGLTLEECKAACIATPNDECVSIQWQGRSANGYAYDKGGSCFRNKHDCSNTEGYGNSGFCMEILLKGGAARRLDESPARVRHLSGAHGSLAYTRCYKAGSPCPLDHSSCAAEYCNAERWGAIKTSMTDSKIKILGFIETAVGDAGLTGRSKADVAKDIAAHWLYDGTKVDGFYFNRVSVDAPHTAEMLELASVMKAKGKVVVFGVGESIMESIVTDTTGAAYTVDVAVALSASKTALTEWNPFAWYPDHEPTRFGALITDVPATEIAKYTTLTHDRGYGYTGLTANADFTTVSASMAAAVTAVAGFTMPARRLSLKKDRALTEVVTDAYNWACDANRFFCQPVCMRTTGYTTTIVADSKCAGVEKLDECSCNCLHDVHWTCQGADVVCVATDNSLVEKVVGDLACSSRGTEKPLYEGLITWTPAGPEDPNGPDGQYAKCSRTKVAQQRSPSAKCLSQYEPLWLPKEEALLQPEVEDFQVDIQGAALPLALAAVAALLA